MNSDRDFLRKCDVQGFEEPEHWDPDELKRMANELKLSLEVLLSGQVGGPFFDQGCMHFALLYLPKETCVTPNGDRCDLRISKFGHMIAFAYEHSVSKDLLVTIKQIVKQKGFRWMDFDVLLSEYDGVEEYGFKNWWMRFFQYY